MTVLDVIDVSFDSNSNLNIMAVVDDFFSGYSQNCEDPVTEPRICEICMGRFENVNRIVSKNFNQILADLNEMNLQWTPIEVCYDV